MKPFLFLFHLMWLDPQSHPSYSEMIPEYASLSVLSFLCVPITSLPVSFIVLITGGDLCSGLSLLCFELLRAETGPSLFCVLGFDSVPGTEKVLVFEK